jgi:hypothetical protein
MPRVYPALIVALTFLGSTSASAEVILLANLTNAQENPPTVPTTITGDPRPASGGTANFILNDAMTSLSFMVSVNNIDFTGSQTTDPNDNLTLAHIHAPAPPGENAGVVWGFIGMPFNDTAPTDTVIAPFTTGVGGMVTTKWDAPEGNNTTLAEQLANILANQSYINFHTVQFPGGETRGQILVQEGQVEPVPEPSTMLMVGFGSAALIRAARGRRKTVAV